MGASQSTSSTTTNYDNRRKYDVIISFRDDDTGDNITSHLYNALSRKKIHTFMDYQQRQEDEISPAFSKAIEESMISIVIFSKNYASSKWCLRVLAEIMKYKKMNKQIVIPVFYHIDPSDVRKQTGSFNHSFVKHEKESREEVQIWRDSLTEASNLSGWHSAVIRPESRLVDEIVKEVLKKLNDASPSSASRDLVGIDSHIEEVLSLLHTEMLDFRVVGIWGMGGIGKTTIAGAVFDQISSQFESCCFIANVREESEKCGGLIHLRNEVISKILEEKINLGTPNIPLFIKRRLRTKRIFLILDDVSNSKQLEILAGGMDQFGSGSRIIITTRDKQLLCNCRVENVYKVEALGYHEALQLLCKYAFKQDQPPTDFMEFIDRIISYAKGNPLALKVVGSSLYKKSKQDWESVLHKLNKISNPEIHNLLRINYDGLDCEEKDIFLDIACFFKGEYESSVMQILSSCYFSTLYGLSVLVDKSLITISKEQIEMHDLLQEMGWEIIRQESIEKPYKRSRLHNHEDIRPILGRNTGTVAVKGMILNMSKMKMINMGSQAFEKMFNLRFLKFYYGTQLYGNQKNFSKVCLPFDLNYLPDELRYLQWDGFPAKALPSSLSLEYIVELRLFDSNVEQLWEGKKHLPMLKWLLLGHSQLLTRIPDLSHSPRLEVIDLQACKNLLDISSSIQNLNNLRHLRLLGCESLPSFSSDIYFESLKSLDLSSCTNLMKFPPLLGNLKTLTLKGTAIDEIPSSIEELKELVVLDVSFCKRLKHISTNICKVKSLTGIDLSDCSKLESLPESINQLSKLRDLQLSNCYKLQSIPELPFCMQYLIAQNCKKLQSLPDTSNFAELLTCFLFNGESPFGNLEFMFTNSLKLNQKAIGNVLEESLLIAFQRMATTEKEYKKEVHVDICYPGSEIPNWFIYQSSNYFVNIQLPQHDWSNRKFMGLAFCVVIKFEEHCFSRRVDYYCHFKTNCGVEVKHSGFLTISNLQNFKVDVFTDSDHVLLGYSALSNFKLLRDDYTTCLVEFLPENGPASRVTHCGVCPLYAEANIHQPSFSGETTKQDLEETTVEEHTETMEFPDEADTSGSGSGRFDDEEMDPRPNTNPLIYTKAVLPYRNSRKVGLLCCNCWIFFVCPLCGLFVFGMLVLLVLHLSTLCEIYLSSHVQNVQGKKF